MRERDAIAERLATLKNRDQVIREAFDHGFTKLEIHRLSGIARTTIDRILKEEP